eukprot:1157178-Pelagomonas_calceolata.AAC.6
MVPKLASWKGPHQRASPSLNMLNMLAFPFPERVRKVDNVNVLLILLNSAQGCTFLLQLSCPYRQAQLCNPFPTPTPRLHASHPQLLHPILKSPTFPIFRMLSSLTCIQNTDLDMPTQKQASTSIAYYLMLRWEIYSSYIVFFLFEKKISNAFRNMPCISSEGISSESPMKCTILQYRTGTLYNQKHPVCFKRSTNPLCPPMECGSSPKRPVQAPQYAG